MKNVLKLFGGDKVIWFLIVILTFYSGLAVASSVVSLANHDGNVAVHIIRHSSFLLIGWFIIYVTHLIPYKWFSVFAHLMVIIAAALLAITLMTGEQVNQAARWLTVPGTSVSFQTSDFAKLALIIFVARYLSRNQDEIRNFKKGFLPVLIWIMLICGLILPANLSTAAILFLSCMVLLMVGRVRILYLLALIAIGISFVMIFFVLASKSEQQNRTGTWQNRVMTYVNPEEGDNFQSDKAKIAIANGGVLGKFAGHSTQRHTLPQAYSDFIFAIIIEEYGFLFGAFPLVFIYLTLLYRAGVIVRKCDRTFPAFLAIGLVIGVVIQAFVNMSVAVGLIPVTGQPLPWISRGGTSLLFTSLAFGILLGISRSVEKKQDEAAA
ncbi:MAG: FtsW/RodA/SpoVE family cell cycle protein [Bacteroidetes bacterium]|jgi:cell division protein FtsW|nr:FtsW/RodA/SpoVE family cell cycle protein [Bacteroidota bacterium]MBT4409209.1 FtsW/RodA/SpoVE family cell cycle protein [Bacteroidota bacterium]MBT5426123.1 FtsW/RodA/SpoVE family cell cycle protein [Bacteroidota bacterium]MBT7464476.1 FtsW/RodA/SpoVE family cell cycle protein [Bacteroidota bacterium]